MIASNTAEISYNAGFISSMKCDGSGYINDPANGLSCCYEDNLNEGTISKSIIRYYFLKKCRDKLWLVYFLPHFSLRFIL